MLSCSENFVMWCLLVMYTVHMYLQVYMSECYWECWISPKLVGSKM